MLNKLLGGGIASAVENLGTEYLRRELTQAEAEKISAEAKAVAIKAIDPNGNMRLKTTACVVYVWAGLIAAIALLILLQAAGIGEPEAITQARADMFELFAPVSALVSAVVLASYGVNAMNTHKGGAK